MQNIYLVGFMGTGKTTVGKLLSTQLNETFVEMDQEIEEREGSKIVDIFATKGEPYFRQREKALLEELASQQGLVVSCGGGLICNSENVSCLKKSGIIFNLTASPTIIYKRTQKYTHRPLLNVDNPLEEITALLEQRQPYYTQAHYSIDTDSLTPQEVADFIILCIQQNNPQ